MRRAALAIAALVAAGCAPQLGDEYLCTAGGPCPPGWRCWADGVCREGEPEAGRYEACDVDAECDTRACAPSTDLSVRDAGSYCSSECTEDDECVFGEDEARCVGGFCRLRCLETPDCPMGTQCWIPFDPGTPPTAEAVCLNVMDPTFSAPPACDGPGDCRVPGLCSNPPDVETGVCAMACRLPPPQMMGGMAPMGTHCPMGTECVDMYSDAGLCLRPCDGSDDECGEGTICTSLTVGGETTSYCTGSDWDALGALPLSNELRMSLPMPTGPGM